MASWIEGHIAVGSRIGRLQALPFEMSIQEDPSARRWASGAVDQDHPFADEQLDQVVGDW